MPSPLHERFYQQPCSSPSIITTAAQMIMVCGALTLMALDSHGSPPIQAISQARSITPRSSPGQTSRETATRIACSLQTAQWVLLRLERCMAAHLQPSPRLIAPAHFWALLAGQQCKQSIPKPEEVMQSNIGLHDLFWFRLLIRTICRFVPPYYSLCYSLHRRNASTMSQ